MLSVEDWAEIRRLRRAEGLPIKTIARTLGVSRNTVRAAEGTPSHLRAQVTLTRSSRLRSDEDPQLASMEIG